MQGVEHGGKLVRRESGLEKVWQGGIWPGGSLVWRKSSLEGFWPGAELQKDGSTPPK